MMLHRSVRVALAFVLAASASSQETIGDVVSSDANLTSLAELVGEAPIIESALSDENAAITLFAPVNDAFNSSNQTLLTKLSEDEWVAHLTNLLLFHGTEGEVAASSITGNTELTMLNNETITANVGDGGGVTLTTAAGQEVTVVTPDVNASNGVIHTIDGILLPEWVETDLVALVGKLGGKGFDTLLKYLNDLDLVGQLSTIQAGNPDSVVTVFAPNDAAFEALGTTNFTNEELLKILTNHVAIDKLYPTEEMEDGDEITTMANTKLKVKIDEGKIMIDDATIVNPDILANNGIIQGIDKVLMLTPSAPSAPSAPTTPTPPTTPLTPTVPNFPSAPSPSTPNSKGTSITSWKLVSWSMVVAATVLAVANIMV